MVDCTYTVIGPLDRAISTFSTNENVVSKCCPIKNFLSAGDAVPSSSAGTVVSGFVLLSAQKSFNTRRKFIVRYLCLLRTESKSDSSVLWKRKLVTSPDSTSYYSPIFNITVDGFNEENG